MSRTMCSSVKSHLPVSDLGNLVSQESYRCLCFCLRKFCGELWRLPCFLVTWPGSIAEIRGDNESAQKLRRKVSKSWLVRLPDMARPPPAAQQVSPTQRVLLTHSNVSSSKRAKSEDNPPPVRAARPRMPGTTTTLATIPAIRSTVRAPGLSCLGHWIVFQIRW